jgi:hypothetical protein
MYVSGLNGKDRNEKEARIGCILFQYPIGGIVAIVAMLLLKGLLLFYYFIVGSEDENHILRIFRCKAKVTR